MNVKELSRAQLDALKTAYVCQTCPAPAWGDLAAAPEIPDAEILAYYAGIEFSPDDFL